MKNYLFIALTVALSFLVFVAFQQAKPASKAPIYQEITKYSPYYIEKRFGGLQIMSREDENFKEKPSNMEIFHRLESLEKSWAKNHLKLVNNSLIISDNNHTTIKTVAITSNKDRAFLHSFYGL